MSMILLILGTVLAIMLPLLVLFQRHVSKRAINVDNKSVAVLVLGDLGRSPRMMYHAQSLSKSGFNVLLIGFAGMFLRQKR
jgi:beta-1,4-mannosyltransferase